MITRWWMVSPFKLLPVVILLSVTLSSSCFLKGLPGVNSAVKQQEENERKSQEAVFERSADFRTLRDECANKRLEDFELIERHLLDREYPLLSYYYHSKIDEKKGFSEFQRLFGQGWEQIENLSIPPTLAFQKDDVRAIVQFGGIQDAEWGVTCVIKNPGER